MKAFLVAIVVCLSAPALAGVPCAQPDIAGLYEGDAKSSDGMVLDVTLNVRCDAGAYHVQFFTSAGDFDATRASFADSHFKLAFDTGSATGTADLVESGTALAGSFGFAGDSGTISLVRKGDALPPDGMKPRIDLTTAQWREDLQFFASTLPKVHANAFFSLSKQEFAAEIATLAARLDHSNNDEILVGFEQVINSVGDGHSYINYPAERFPLPIEIAKFGNDFRISATGPGLEHALGARILKIEATPIDEAYRKALTLTPRGELDELREGRAVIFLTRGIVLHGLDISPARDHAVFTLAGEDGKAFTMDFKGAPPGADIKLSSGPAPKPLSQQRTNEPFRCENLAEAKAVYCAFRAYENLADKTKAMFALIDQAHPDKLIVDMRDNGGGDNTVGYSELIKPIEGRADLNRKGRLFVLIGPLTFSAAMNNAAQFADETKATLVGQTIGERPNSYQEPRQFRLPNSHLVVRASTVYYEFRKHGENAVRPDKEIIPTWDDMKAGRDPVMDWVLAQKVE
jgi:hypothetical protein